MTAFKDEKFYGLYQNKVFEYSGQFIQQLNITLPKHTHAICCYKNQIFIVADQIYLLTQNSVIPVQVRVTTPLETVSSELPKYFLDIHLQNNFQRTLILNLANLQMFNVESYNQQSNLMLITVLTLSQQVGLQIVNFCDNFSIITSGCGLMCLFDLTKQVPDVVVRPFQLRFEQQQFHERQYADGLENWGIYFGIKNYQNQKESYMKLIKASCQ